MEQKKRVSPSVVEVLEDSIRAKDEFIVFLLDEVNWLRALLKEERPERVKIETDFKSSRGYKSNYTKIREQVLANKAKHKVVPISEEKSYESVEVEND